jgi:hypothetical protein
MDYSEEEEEGEELAMKEDVVELNNNIRESIQSYGLI